MTRWIFLLLVFAACTPVHKLDVPARRSATGGSAFYHQAFAMNWKERDSLVLHELKAGNLPSFLTRLVPVTITGTDSVSGQTHTAVIYVTPDYLSVGTDTDWARINITPYAAQEIADLFQCYLPTRKIVDEIYNEAKVKLEPVPMYAYRDSTPTMWQHHLIIEGQRQGRRGLIAGIQKDVVISSRIARDPKPNRVAIYGWHQLNGKPIQPLYTGHIYWWVDYSQGIRLIWKKVKLDGHWMEYSEVLKNPALRYLLCDEADCDFYRYPLSPRGN